MKIVTFLMVIALLSSLYGNMENEKLLAEQGDVEAQVKLANFYYSGRGMYGKDYEKAAYYYEMAANQGHAESQYIMATLNFNGLGIEQDTEKAVNWYRIAALQGHPLSQEAIALFYEQGVVVEQNYIEAAKWYMSAAEQFKGVTEPDTNHWGRFVGRNHNKAKELLLLSSETGNTEAFIQLGKLYEYGKGVEQNYQTAYKMYQTVALMEGLDLEFIYENIVLHGVADELHTNKHVTPFVNIEEEDIAASLYGLAFMYDMGIVVQQDDYRATELYMYAAENRYTDSYQVLCRRFAEGIGVYQDWEKAYFWSLIAHFMTDNEFIETAKDVRDRASKILSLTQMRRIHFEADEWLMKHND